jgi:hypothetical protein
LRDTFLALFSAALLLLSFVPGQAACMQAIVQGLHETPKDLLDRYPRGGKDLLGSIRSLAMTSGDALRAVVSVIRVANLDQRNAIGSGLAAAFQACNSRDPVVSRRIAAAIEQINDLDVLRAYHRYLGSETPSSLEPTPSGQGEVSRRGAGVGIQHSLDLKELPLGDPRRPLGE